MIGKSAAGLKLNLWWGLCFFGRAILFREFSGDTTGNGRFGYGTRYGAQQTRIQWFGDDVVAAEYDVFHVVSLGDQLRDILFSQIGQCLDSSNLHFLVDGSRPHVQSPAENEGKAQHIVDLIGVVAATGGHDHIFAGGRGLFIADLRRRVGHRKNNGIFSHRLNHFNRHDIADGQA